MGEYMNEWVDTDVRQKQDRRSIMTLLKVFLLGSVMYLLMTFLVKTFYQDNPDQMEWQVREVYNQKFIQSLIDSNNTYRQQVLSKLGGPDITEAKKVNGHIWQVFFYRTQLKESDGFTTREECTALLFKDDNLVSVGPIAYEQYNEIL